MRNLQGKLTWVIVRPFLLAILLFLPLSATYCHARDCFRPTGNYPPNPSITSISPDTWVRGQTYNVVITGQFTLAQAPGPRNNCVYDVVTITLPGGGGPSYLTGSEGTYINLSQTGFSVTVAPNAPPGALIVGITCEDCDHRGRGTDTTFPGFSAGHHAHARGRSERRPVTGLAETWY